jgi:hypothetical protein
MVRKERQAKEKVGNDLERHRPPPRHGTRMSQRYRSFSETFSRLGRKTAGLIISAEYFFICMVTVKAAKIRPSSREEYA